MMMSSITRMRTVRRKSSRLSTWLYNDGPLVPRWVARALIVRASQPSRSKKVSAAFTMISRLSLPPREGDFDPAPDRPADDSGSAGMAIALRLHSRVGWSTTSSWGSPERRTLVCPRREHVGSVRADHAPWREEHGSEMVDPLPNLGGLRGRDRRHVRRRRTDRARQKR